VATNKVTNFSNKQTRKQSVLISTQESSRRIRKLSVAIREDVIGGNRQTTKRSVAAKEESIGGIMSTRKLLTAVNNLLAVSVVTSKQEIHCDRKLAGHNPTYFQCFSR
jgi:hypothetical protein